MPCRGGLLSQEQIGVLTDNQPLCTNIDEHWDKYLALSARAIAFGRNQDGQQEYQALDVLNLLKVAINGQASELGLSVATHDAQLKLDDAVELIARAVFESQERCSVSVKQTLAGCTGHDD